MYSWCLSETTVAVSAVAPAHRVTGRQQHWLCTPLCRMLVHSDEQLPGHELWLVASRCAHATMVVVAKTQRRAALARSTLHRGMDDWPRCSWQAVAATARNPTVASRRLVEERNITPSLSLGRGRQAIATQRAADEQTACASAECALLCCAAPRDLAAGRLGYAQPPVAETTLADRAAGTLETRARQGQLEAVARAQRGKCS